MIEEARMVVYNPETGEKIREIPLTFYFAWGEEDVNNREFCLECFNPELHKGEAVIINIPLSKVLKEIQEAMKAK